METKICNTCLVEKELYEFYRNTKGYYYGKCIQCLKNERDNKQPRQYMGRVTQALREWCQTQRNLSKMGYNVEDDIHLQFLKRFNLKTYKSKPAANVVPYKLSDCDKIKKPHS